MVQKNQEKNESQDQRNLDGGVAAGQWLTSGRTIRSSMDAVRARVKQQPATHIQLSPCYLVDVECGLWIWIDQNLDSILALSMLSPSTTGTQLLFFSIRDHLNNASSHWPQCCGNDKPSRFTGKHSLLLSDGIGKQCWRCTRIAIHITSFYMGQKGQGVGRRV
jgi:hypothetical protein